MPPKKGKGKGKGKSKGGKKKKSIEVVQREPDEFDNMSQETLSIELNRMKSELKELSSSRNYYELQRDELQKFYSLVKEEVSETSFNVRNIESQMEHMKDTHRQNINVYLQKVVHLEYEHSQNLESIKSTATQVLEEELKTHEEERLKLNKKKCVLNTSVQEEESNNEQEIAKLKDVGEKEIRKLREEFDKGHDELHMKYDKRLTEMRDELELRRKMEMHEIEERKNRHINDLMKNHERAFTEMRNYYNSITRENLELIKYLKDELTELKARSADNERTIEEVTRKNEMLAEPLAQAETRVTALKERLRNFDKDRASLKRAKKRVVTLEDQLKRLIVKQDTLQDEYAHVEAERDELYANFEQTVRAVQERGSIKSREMEQKLSQYQTQFETKKQQFASVLQSANLDVVALDSITRTLDTTLTSKNDEISELVYEANKISKARDELVRTCMAKLHQLGVAQPQAPPDYTTQSHFAAQYSTEEDGNVDHATATAAAAAADVDDVANESDSAIESSAGAGAGAGAGTSTSTGTGTYLNTAGSSGLGIGSVVDSPYSPRGVSTSAPSGLIVS
jgi:dynein regulatory complex subunit 4